MAQVFGCIALRILQKIEEIEGMMQKKLAEALGVSQQQISKIVKGHENLTLETISKLSEALDTELISFPEIKASHKRKKADYSIREEETSVVAGPQAKYYTKAKKQPRIKGL
jgi:plasmid maintenance system antidote protein VapI